MRKHPLLLSLFFLLYNVFILSAQTDYNMPPKREFRGAWIQCVNGQYLGKSSEQIRQMLSSQLDVLYRAGINAIMFQVRPEGDALYNSTFEPWSRYLTGTQGTAPQDGWDPLQWMIEQCHSRGMECHAWINPYRMKTKGTTSLAITHPAIRHKEWIVTYGDLYILNPALKESRDYTCLIIEDIIQRYDVDGIHMDDYFYPYPEPGTVFDDDIFFMNDNRGFDNKADWRRDNVNLLISDIHKLIRKEKPWIKFGISPFGIYRNDPTEQNTQFGSATRGLQNYDELYADVVKWQKEGWVDYLIPQVYWNFGTKAADYGILLHWWNDYCNNRPLYIGQDVERTVKGQDLNDSTRHQMDAKYQLQRSLPNIQGSCQWYAAAVVDNPGNYCTILEKIYHKYPALQPKMAFISNKTPKRPGKIKITRGTDGNCLITWKRNRTKNEMKRAVSYAIYDFPSDISPDIDNPRYLKVVTRNNSVVFNGDLSGHTIVVTALDHLQNESKQRILKVR